MCSGDTLAGQSCSEGLLLVYPATSSVCVASEPKMCLWAETFKSLSGALEQSRSQTIHACKSWGGMCVWSFGVRVWEMVGNPVSPHLRFSLLGNFFTLFQKCSSAASFLLGQRILTGQTCSVSYLRVCQSHSVNHEETKLLEDRL